MDISLNNDNNINTINIVINNETTNKPPSNKLSINLHCHYINLIFQDEKDLHNLRMENFELKENNSKLVEKIKELERKFTISNIKLEKNDILNFEVLLTERDIKIKKLKEKEEKLNKLIDEANISVEIFETQFQNDNGFFKEIPSEQAKNNNQDINIINSNLLSEYQKCLISNIRKREEEKKKHKLLLEKLLILANKYKEVYNCD